MFLNAIRPTVDRGPDCILVSNRATSSSSDLPWTLVLMPAPSAQPVSGSDGPPALLLDVLPGSASVPDALPGSVLVLLDEWLAPGSRSGVPPGSALPLDALPVSALVILDEWLAPESRSDVPPVSASLLGVPPESASLLDVLPVSASVSDELPARPWVQASAYSSHREQEWLAAWRRQADGHRWP